MSSDNVPPPLAFQPPSDDDSEPSDRTTAKINQLFNNPAYSVANSKSKIADDSSEDTRGKFFLESIQYI